MPDGMKFALYYAGVYGRARAYPWRKGGYAMRLKGGGNNSMTLILIVIAVILVLAVLGYLLFLAPR